MPSTVQKNKPPVAECTERKAIKIGDIVEVSLATDAPGEPLRWSTDEGELKLADGHVQSVKILPDPPNGTGGLGACLKADDYMRLQKVHGNVPDPAYLIAAPDVEPGDDVLIGDYSANPNAQFVVHKVDVPTNVGGPIIHRGDQFQIRGTHHDYWLLAPAGAAPGTKVALDRNPAKASNWKFHH